MELIGEERLVERRADLLHFGLRLRRFDEEEIGAGTEVSFAAAEGLVETERRARIGARKDEEVLRAARVGGNLNLVHHLFGGNDVAVGRVAALLGNHLVLELDDRYAGLLVTADRVVNIEQTAVTGVAVGDQRLVR